MPTTASVSIVTKKAASATLATCSTPVAPVRNASYDKCGNYYPRKLNGGICAIYDCVFDICHDGDPCVVFAAFASYCLDNLSFPDLGNWQNDVNCAYTCIFSENFQLPPYVFLVKCQQQHL
uniref:EB domain-containing protein n=1 Tax=Panagrellus redivivus TaxID=6233 RepID=A0A7E4VZZ0_PANRE